MLVLAGCVGNKSTSTNQRDTKTQNESTEDSARVSANLFGTDLPWINLGNRIVEYGELIRDRSFRQGVQPDNSGAIWEWFSDDTGSVSVEATQGAVTEMGVQYDGYITIDQPLNGSTCINQPLLDGINEGEQYQLTYYAKKEQGNPTLWFYLADDQKREISEENEHFVSITDDQWSQYSVEFNPAVRADQAQLVVCLLSLNENAPPQAVSLDELRLSMSGADKPVVKQAIKDKLVDLGVTSLRWPGGAYADSFDWKKSVGTAQEREELSIQFDAGSPSEYQTPMLGLHEFLNLCEELGITPVIVINVLDTPQSAADLVEYIFSSQFSGQGMIRAQNGRDLAWRNVRYFEIGAAPNQRYSADGQADGQDALNDDDTTAAYYAEKAKSVISAMQYKARSLSVDIAVSGIVETSFQLADWVTADATDPRAAMLNNWNEQVFDASTGLLDTVNLLHGQFFSYFSYDEDETVRYQNAMSAGAVLAQTLEKIAQKSDSMPIWISGYQAYIGTGQPMAQFTKDFQSGLVVADILISMINNGVAGGHLSNLSEQSLDGMLVQNGTSWAYRPTALVFKLFSPLANERLLDVQLESEGVLPEDVTTITTGTGNIPSELSYANLVWTASINESNDKPRIFILNKHFEIDAQIQMALEGYEFSGATIYRYENADLSANNESGLTRVEIVSSEADSLSPFSLTVPKHSLVRIDFY